MGKHHRVVAVAAVAVAAVVSMPRFAAAQQGMKPEPPKWLDDEGKDLFMDLEADENLFGDAACEVREKLLKKMAGKGEKDAADRRALVLLGLGLCEFRKGEYAISKRRIDSCTSEMNMPSDDVMLQHQHLAHIALIKQAASFLAKHEVTQASTALRRCREILDRNLRKVVKQWHKQVEKQGQGQVPPVDLILSEVPGNGKTGQYLPMLVKQVPMLKQDFGFAEIVDSTLDSLDRRMAGIDASLKEKRLRLDSSKGKSGSLLYVRGLATEAFVPASRSGAAQELISSGATEAFLKEAASVEKGVALLKRTQEGAGCKEGKGFEATCKALLKVGDVASNGFGETRVAMVKAGKKQQLDVCTTNGNIGVLVAAKAGASVQVKGAASAAELPPGEPVVFDSCREATLEASSTVPVLFAQAWHPEFAAVERTTELRARAKAFGLSEDEVKAATKAVNDNAKKLWEKHAKLWRAESEGHAALKQAFEEEAKDKKSKVEEAAEAKRKEEDASDEERQKQLEALQRKRDEKKRREEEAEQKRRQRAKQLEDERAKRDPWLNFPEVLAAERAVEELKEARRDANAKLEFDLSTQLSKDINSAERALAKAIKVARKAYKKHGGPAPADKSTAGGETAAKGTEAAKEDGELKKLRRELEDVKAKKAAAARAENFKEAKTLKATQEELEAKIKKLEL